MKKSIIRVISLALLLGLTVIGAASCAQTADFIVGFDADFPPYGYIDDNGEYTGFDIELAKEVAMRNGWSIELKAIDWDTKDFQLESGSINCIWNGFTMTGREDDYTWSAAYVDNSQVIVTSSASGISSISDLAGKTLAVQSDSSAESVMTDGENPEMLALTASLKELKRYPEYNTAFIALESGAVDAIAMDIGVAKYQIASRTGFIMLDEILATEQYGIGFLAGNTELRDAVSKTLKELMDDGTFDRLAERFGIDGAIKW
ncbi:MAG: transporter substrate-binding domain-containing protein [Clostridia bacterium]|nr:transporter substrate-binding domain-containing protein [Clostridia bacterium]